MRFNTSWRAARSIMGLIIARMMAMAMVMMTMTATSVMEIMRPQSKACQHCSPWNKI
jgi:hypothetical protein